MENMNNNSTTMCANGCWPHLLPKPPVPPLEHTLVRYLEYAWVLTSQAGNKNGNAFQNTLKNAQIFLKVDGPKLQKMLAELAKREDNWVNRFWLPQMYLRQRAPLPLNSNPAYVFPRRKFRNELDYIIYAGLLIKALLEFNYRIDGRQIPCDRVRRHFGDSQRQPLCMGQYERLFKCYRQPSLLEDVLLHRGGRDGGNKNKEEGGGIAVEHGRWPTGKYKEEEDEHIIVLSNGQAFVLYTKCDGGDGGAQSISPSQIVSQLAKCRRESANCREKGAAAAIGVATAGNRDRADQFWGEMCKDMANQRNLDLIQSALFVVCLDQKQSSFSRHHQKLGPMEFGGHAILHGFGPNSNGMNRWFDATLQLIVTPEGHSGICFEHSPADGIVIIGMCEQILRQVNDGKWAATLAQQNISATPPDIAADAELRKGVALMCWSVSEVAATLLNEQFEEFERMANNFQLCVLKFGEFGKNAIKGWHLSPDGVVQLGMQLAYYKSHHILTNTYESASMRRFRLGRVENIRAATPEALAWVKAMMDDGDGWDNSNLRRTLFLIAANKHARITQENLDGLGIDNHLCALAALNGQHGTAPQNDATPFFDDPIWAKLNQQFPLSTSQVSTSPDLEGSYICYGPVAEDGYGCSYNIQPERIIFAISAWESSALTNVEGFKANLRESMRDIQAMFTK